MDNTPSEQPAIVLPLMRFVLLDSCPPDWRQLDLYLFRDDEVVFYVGQSQSAFDRAWEHILNGFKWRSTVGRFILCNWPVSLKFSLELMSSRSRRFASLGHDLNAAEQALIRQYSPCFNETLNSRPTPIPARYTPPNGRLRCSRSLNRLVHEAERAVQADEKRQVLREFGEGK
jgi:hypothetical protein